MFQEYTLEKIVSQEWRDWLYSEIMGAMSFEAYDTE